MSKLQWKQKVYRDRENLYIINFTSEKLDLGEDVTIIDIMQWMISHQQARRNLTPGELIFANSMVAEEIAEENKKMLSTLKQNQKKRKTIVLSKWTKR